MAIKLEFINLIVPVPTLDRVFAERGGFAFFKSSFGSMRDMVWSDEDLCRVGGAMTRSDSEGLVEQWEERGLRGLVASDAGRKWTDFCLATPVSGPTHPCDWLDFDPADKSVWRRGRPKGRVVTKADANDERLTLCSSCGADATAEFLRSYVCGRCRQPPTRP